MQISTFNGQSLNDWANIVISRYAVHFGSRLRTFPFSDMVPIWHRASVQGSTAVVLF